MVWEWGRAGHGVGVSYFKLFCVYVNGQNGYFFKAISLP